MFRSLLRGCGGLLAGVLLLSPSAGAQQADGELLESSRTLTALFAQRLKSELQAAMAAGGPVAAIRVCRDEAPRIASELSRHSGARVGRTSLGIRNPVNAPEPWQREVMQQYFEPEVAAHDGRVEYFVQARGGVRYMQAIRAGGLCLTCHGRNVSGELAQQLATDYPYDQATGYAAGQLRGAFSIMWPDAAD